MFGFLERLLAGFYMAFKQPLESFIWLETADDEHTLASNDGSLISFVRIDGARQIIGDAEYHRIIDQATIKLGSRFDRLGHTMQVFFMRNPDRAQPELSALVRPSQNAAQGIGLEMQDLFEERIRHLAKYLAWEDIYFVLWTRPIALTKSDMERAFKDRQNRKWVAARDAQNPFAALPMLRNRHKSYVASVISSMDEIGIQARLVEVHDALSAVRASLYPNRAHQKWRACLPGDPIPVRMPRGKNDWSDVLWPPLRRQLAVADAEEIDQNTVKIGDLIWSGVDISLAPMDPTPFSQLLSRLVEASVPFRISFLLEGGGTHGAGTKRLIASLLGFSSDVNKQIKASIENLEELAKNEAVVGFRISLATWAPANDRRLLDERVSMLIQATESWGYCQVTQVSGDPLETVLSSTLGISCESTAPRGIAPLYEIVKLLPWARASSPFHSGSIMFRTPDGRVWPYQTGSTLTTTWFDLIFAQPGAGKSVLMNALNLGTCLTPGMGRLPYVAVVDIGPSSSGLISLLRDALPPNRRHEAAHYRLRMTQDYAVNPFDTQLGCRYPLPDERSYLIELLTLLCTPPGQSAPYDGIPQLAGLVVDEMFRWRDDNANNAEPRPYLTRISADVDDAVRRYNINLPADPYWWDVVDALYERGLFIEASSAQRQAVPVLTDAVTAARRPQIRALLEETQIGASSEGVIHAFERMIASAIREYPILSTVTRFDISMARVCALDLQDVAPQGDDTADRQTAIMYMLARHTLVRSWWINEDAIKVMPAKYQPYHQLRLRDVKETPKRLCYDEFHRTSKSLSVRSQIVRDVREGRKWGVQIVLASQLLDDFDDNMVDLATGVWVLGAAVSDRAVKVATERFGLTDTAQWIMRNRLTGPRAGGAPALLVLGTNEGRYEQFLINTLGPIELWALSTSAEDVALRARLYARLGAGRARQILAAHFPGGSARNEIQRRVTFRAERGELDAAASSAVIEEIVTEMVTSATRQQAAALAGKAAD